MKRKVIWSIVILLSLVTITACWFIANYERVEIEKKEEASKEVYQNPWLAMERFLVKMQREVQVSHASATLDNLPEHGVLILDRMRQTYLTDRKNEILLDWVERGGYLILVSEQPGRPDTIASFFDVSNKYRSRKTGRSLDCPGNERRSSDDWAGEASAPDTESETEKSVPLGTCTVARKSMKVHIPGIEEPFFVNTVYGYLHAGSIVPGWSAGMEDHGQAIMHFAYGQGNVTIISYFDTFFSNWQIAEKDHAALLWSLLEIYQQDKKPPIILLSQVPLPSLWVWLVESAWMALTAFVILLLMWLWSVMPRFGLIDPPPAPVRRELGEHLAALGRFAWRSGKLGEWLEIARESFSVRLSTRAPHLFALSPQMLVTKLAGQSGLSASSIQLALYGNVTTMQSFTQAIRTLRNLEQTL